MTDAMFVAAIRQVHDQARESIVKFVTANEGEMMNVLARYKVEADSGEPQRIMDGLLAAFGLVTAILEKYDRLDAKPGGEDVK